MFMPGFKPGCRKRNILGETAQGTAGWSWRGATGFPLEVRNLEELPLKTEKQQQVTSWIKMFFPLEMGNR